VFDNPFLGDKEQASPLPYNIKTPYFPGRGTIGRPRAFHERPYKRERTTAKAVVLSEVERSETSIISSSFESSV
jgi:hypothetical protein